MRDGEWRGTHHIASTYWKLITPFPILSLANKGNKVSPIFTCGVQRRHISELSKLWACQDFPSELGFVGWRAGKAYLAGCFAGLNNHGTCRCALDVEIMPGNHHFLFQTGCFIVEISFLFIHEYCAQTLPLRKSQAVSIYSLPSATRR